MSRKTLSKYKYSLLLILAALIWGFAFSAQSVAAGLGTFSFNAARGLVAVIALIPIVRFFCRNLRLNRKTWIAGTFSGTALFAASALQQEGLVYTTPGKAAFITTLYLVLVTVVSLLMAKRVERRVILAVILAVIGLYFICIKKGDDLSDITRGDILELCCAGVFTVQILIVDHYKGIVDPIKFTFVQMIVYAVLSCIAAMIFERTPMQEYMNYIPSILYCGLLSSTVAYTLQNVGQHHLSPVIATICLSLESVFSVIGQWIVLGIMLSSRELWGCAIMLVAVLLAQIDPGMLGLHIRRKDL